MTGISIDPFDKDQLANIHRHHWKECIKMSKLAKFESDMSEVSTHTNVNVATLQSYIFAHF